MVSNWRSRDEHSKIGVHLLVVLLGITSWSIMNGLWVELPILVVHLPEGWTLPSFLTIICQFGNIGPIVFSLLAYCMPKRKIETPTSFVIVVALTLCAVLYAFLWRQTAPVGPDTHSVALLSLTLCQAIFAATTSMAYLAFMAHLKAQYIGSIFIGMSLSGLIPALAAIGQNPGEVRCVENTGEYVTSDNKSDLTYSGLSQARGDNISTYSMSKENMGSLSLQESHIFSTLSSLVLDEDLISGSASQNHSNMTLTPYNEEPAFTVQSFFLMLASLGGLSFISLLMLIHHPYCTTEHVDTAKEDHCQLVQVNSHQPLNTKTLQSTESERTVQWNKEEQTIHEVTEHGPVSLDDVTTTQASEHHDGGQEERQLSQLQSWYLLGLLAWINILQTSFILAIQVYSSLPYGLFFYNGATKAENIVDPIACFLTMWIKVKSTRVISSLTLLGTLFTAYIITVAAMSPNPILVHQTVGGVLVIAAWVISTALNVFAKVTIASVMRTQGRTSLIYTGGSTQLGALIGAVLAYVMVNQLHLFKDSPWC